MIEYEVGKGTYGLGLCFILLLVVESCGVWGLGLWMFLAISEFSLSSLIWFSYFGILSSPIQCFANDFEKMRWKMLVWLLEPKFLHFPDQTHYQFPDQVQSYFFCNPKANPLSVPSFPGRIDHFSLVSKTHFRWYLYVILCKVFTNSTCCITSILIQGF